MRLAMEPAHVQKPAPVKKPTVKNVAPVRSSSSPRSTYTSSRVSAPTRTISAPKPVAKPAPKPVIKAPAPAAKTGLKIPAPNDTITPMTPAIPGIEDWLTGDTTYQDQEAQLRRAYAEFMAGQQLDQGNYEQNYAQQLRDLGKAKTTGFEDLQNDYAGRGLLKSGLYADAYSGLQSQFDDRQTGLDTAKAQYLAGLNQSAAGFQNDQNTTLTSAKQEAIARRAAKYNLGV